VKEQCHALARIGALFDGHLPAPAGLLAVDPAKLREAGLSWRKIGTLGDVAERLSDGRLDQAALSELLTIAGQIVAVLPLTWSAAPNATGRLSTRTAPGRQNSGLPASMRRHTDAAREG
jgi:hypothetical protein